MELGVGGIARKAAEFALSRGLVQAVGLAKLLVLVRLLTPMEFGIMGVVLIVCSVIESVSITGIDVGLINRKGDIDEYLGTAWIVSVARGILLSVFLFLMAWPISVFFRSPESRLIIQCVSPVFMFRGLTSSRIVQYIRDIDIRRQAVLSSAEAFTDAFVAIILAILLGNAWAMAIGFLAGSVARCAASHAVCGRMPRPRFDMEKFRELTRNSRFIWASNIMVVLGNKVDSIVVGRVAGVGDLGIYQVGNKLTDPVGRELGGVLSQIIYPSFSQRSKDIGKLRSAYLRAARAVFGLLMPVSLWFLLYTTDVVPLILGDRWIDAAPVVRILMAAFLFRGLFAIDGWLYYALDEARNTLVMTSIRLTILSVLLIPATLMWGIEGAAGSLLVANLSLAIPSFWFGRKMLGLRAVDYLRRLAGPAAAFTAALLPVHILFSGALGMSWWVPASLGALLSVATLFFLERELFVSLWTRKVAEQ